MIIDELLDLDERESLQHLYAAAILNRVAIAIWRLPHAEDKHAVIDFSKTLERVDACLETTPTGFILAPFLQSSEKSSFLIESHIQWNSFGGELMARGIGRNGTAEMQKEAQFLATLKGLPQETNKGGQGQRAATGERWYAPPEDSAKTCIDNETFLRWIRSAVREIRQGQVQKIVLSRAVRSTLGSDFHPLALFHRLCEAYSNAFVSLVAIPNVGTWIGATPELLLQRKDNHLRTVALAGTQSATANPVWTRKELEEQAIVADFIRDCFLQHGAKEFLEDGPETMQIGKLLHLRTTFDLRLTSHYPGHFTSSLLELLHPTPAVGGVPKERANGFIETTETHDREFYSGFLGPVNFDAASHIFVNLRCMQLLQTDAILYAGSGITKDSIAEQECLETELKLKALSSILDQPLARSPHEAILAKEAFLEQGAL